VRRLPITLVDGKFHIGGIPEAAKLIAIPPLPRDLARRYVDLILHHSDLRFAQECLDALSSQQATVPLIAEALWQSAIVRYCKCFGKPGATRAALPYSKILPAGMPRDVHRYFIDLRNKHLVHDENAWTQATPMAIIAAEGGNDKIEEVVCSNIAAVTRSTTNVSNLRLLIGVVLPWVESQVDSLNAEIKDELEKLPYEELMALPEPDPYYAAKAEDVSKKRTPNGR
jgi:hypothetical protein